MSAGPLHDPDPRFMEVASTLGRRGLGRTWPNPAVGALVVKDGGAAPIIVGRGWTQAGGRPHAETEALARAGAAAHGATLYVTLEPCSHHGRTPPCADAIIASGIRRVISAMEDPNPLVAGTGHARLRAAGIDVHVGVGRGIALRDHAGHIRRMRDARPHVLLKLAISADEKAGLAGRRTATITGEPARGRVHLMRAQSDAVLIGIGTALADDPLLTCRLPGLLDRTPVRIVVDTHLRLPDTLRLARTTELAPVWVITSTKAAHEHERALRACGVEVIRLEPEGHGLALPTVLRYLAARGITRLMVEGGPILAAALVAADLVDEVALLRSPHVIGSGGIDVLEGLLLTRITQAPHLVSQTLERIGEDTLEIFERTT